MEANCPIVVAGLSGIKIGHYKGMIYVGITVYVADYK
jgi:hypothetical protein